MSITEEHPTVAPDAEERIAELEATVASLVKRLESQPATADQAAPSEAPPQEGSRRGLFKLAAGAAAGGTALALARSTGPAAATDGQSVVIGDSRTQGDTGRTTTVIDYENTDGPRYSSFLIDYDANIFTVRDRTTGFIIVGSENSSAYPAAIGGYGNSAVNHGVYGRSSSGGFGVVAQGASSGSVGLLARGQRANIEMYNEGDAPATRSDAHVRGELLTDVDGDLWYCVAAGTPGTWQKLSGIDTAGAFHAVTPFRVYDSREAVDGGLPGSSDTTISVKDARDVESYAVTTVDAVPDGATAISANIVAIGTTGNGFATVNPGGDGSVGAAALNWSEGQTIGNAGIFKIDSNRKLEVLVRGITNIDLTIDVTGYWR